MRLKEKINRKNILISLVLLFIVTGIFFRTYHFSDWLEFEIDQSYDINIVSPAVEHGVDNLPLLGPTAGGGRALRLGPAFYYMQYLTAKIFGNTPPGHAMLVLLLSIASLPLFYLLVRKYFSIYVSLSLLLLYSVSIYSVLYSRFSWSPNVLPFFIILLFYSLLHSTSKEEKYRDRWFLLSVSILAIITQIHFNAFFVVPVTVAGFLIFTRPRFKWSTWIFGILIFFFIYAPVIISDVKMNGENLQFFIKKFTKTEDPKYTKETALRASLQYDALEYALILTGQDHVNDRQIRDLISLSNCTKECSINLPWEIISLFLLAGTIALLIFNFLKEKDANRRNFIVLNFLFFIFSTFLFYSLIRGGYRMRPRFFLLVSPLAFVFFGLFLEKIYSIKKIGLALIIIITVFLASINIKGIIEHFSDLKKVQQEDMDVGKDDVFPDTKRITLQQQIDTVDYIESKFKQNKFPVYLDALHEYEPAIWYQLEKRGIPYYGRVHTAVAYEQANYFNIDGSVGSKLWLPFDIVERRIFGNLSVYYMKPKPEKITAVQQDPATKELSDQAANIANLYTWKKLLNNN